MTMKNYKNCFARIDAGCGVLKETLCENGKCPFYKSKKQYEADQVKYSRLKYSSIKKNGGEFYE